MKKLSGLALSLGLVGCAGGGADVDAAAGSGAEQAIINGAECGADEEASAVAIMLDATITFQGRGSFDMTTVLCTGTLIAPDVVMLAAHCTDTDALTFGLGTVDRADFYVTFEADLEDYAGGEPGGEPLPIPESAVPVRDFVAHPNFDINSLGQGTSGTESDIALFFLAAKIEGVRPEVVITKEEAAQLEDGSVVTIAGWGQQTQTGQFQQPPPGTVGIKMCGASTIDELGSTLMQIGADPDSVRKCHGDSGGPTYTEVSTSGSIKRRVIGVTSRAYDEQDCGKGGVDTRVDAYLDFIDDEMRARCEDGSRVFCDVEGIVPASFYENGGGGGGGEEGEGEGDGPGDVTPVTGCPGGCGAGSDVGFVGLGLLSLLMRRKRR